MRQIRYRRDLCHIVDCSLPAAELGVAEGYFSADILSWGVPKLYMVDAWKTLAQAGDGNNPKEWHDKNYKDAIARVEKYGEKPTILKGLSTEMAGFVPDNSLGFVNVDCDHSYDGVKNDIKHWWPKLVSGGVMAFHDYHDPKYGVKVAVHEFAKSEGLQVHYMQEDKQEDAGVYLIKK